MWDKFIFLNVVNNTFSANYIIIWQKVPTLAKSTGSVRACEKIISMH